MDCSTPGFLVLHYLLEFAQIYVRWVSDAIQPSHPLLPPSPFAFNLSERERVFPNKFSSFHQVPKCWSFSFSISPSNEYSELISFRTDWLDLLAVQGTLKSLLQHQSLKVSIIQPLPNRCQVHLPHPECNKPTCSQTLTAKWPLPAKLSWLRTIAIEDDIFFFLFLSSSSRFLWHFALLTYYYVFDSY